ncbi:hypothetical protein J6590_074968 [Homalodisca vitripennis]|nr:hypothetical protein J6590_074968 [Homalodisca vitripennis]
MKLFPTSKNARCTANSSSALVWKALGFEFQGQTVAVEENVFVHDALYPMTEEDVSESFISLSNVLESLIAVEFQNIGIWFTGQTVTVAFCHSQEQLYLFDLDPVKENRTHDLANDINNLARLFQCDTFPALASLLLSNAALDGSVRQYSITRLTFRSSTFSENIQNLTMHETANNSAIKPKYFGRPKKIKPGRPQILKTTRDEYLREAAAVRHYEDRHPGAGQDRVQVFRLMKPKIREFRHLPNSLARNIVAQGLMAHWSSKLICDIGVYNVTRLASLSPPFYSDGHFLNRARAYNDLFSFCALEISGGYRQPSGLSFFKIEGRMYHQVYSLDDPGQRFATKRAGTLPWVDHLILELLTPLPITWIRSFHRSNGKRSFGIPGRATHGNVLGDRNRGVEVHAVLSTDEALTEPRRLASSDGGSPSSTHCSIYMALWVGKLAFLIATGKKLSQYNHTRFLLLSSPRFSYLGRLSQAWQVEMFARYEEERLRLIKFSQSRSSVQNAMRIGQLNEILDAQRNAPAGIQVREDITRTRRGWRKAWQNLPPKFVYRWALIHEDSLRECNGSRNTVMTGHKSQGQTIDLVGVVLRTDCFTYGQLYLLLSRVRRPEHIVVLVRPNRVCDELHRKFPLLITNI